MSLSPFIPGSGAQAQRPSPRLSSIHVVGQQRYTEAQIIAASGLRPGQAFDANALNAAADRLGQSGAFEEVRFRYQPDGQQMSVEFTVKENSKLRRCVFDNFVWVGAQELQAHLERKVPLFNKLSPESGTLIDDITASLEILSQDRGIATHVEHTQFFPKMGDPEWEHLFIARGPSVKIQGVQFQGVSGIDEAVLHHEAAPLLGRNFSFVDCRLFGQAVFVAVYRERGYLRIRIGDPAAMVLNHAQGTNEYEIQIAYPVTEGLVYDWEPAEWSGNQVIASSELDALMGLKPKDLANGKKIDRGWEAIPGAYGKKGHIEVSLSPEPSFDDATRRVRYRVRISEGAQYRMGVLLVTGLPSAAAERLKSRWRLKPAEVFDASYLQDFVKTELSSILSGFSGRAPRIRMETRPDRSRLTVDVVIRVE